MARQPRKVNWRARQHARPQSGPQETIAEQDVIADALAESQVMVEQRFSTVTGIATTIKINALALVALGQQISDMIEIEGQQG